MNIPAKQSRIKGVTLIEVLVAIVITSVGILGFASLQFLGLNSNASAYARSQATFVATNMSERMRANIQGLNDNQYTGLDSSALPCTSVTGNFCDERNNGGTAIAAQPCTTNQLATHDFFTVTCGYSSNDYANATEKTTLLGDLLANGKMTIICNDSDTTDVDPCTDYSDHTITVTWDEQDEGTSNGKLQMTGLTTKILIHRFKP